MLETDLVSRFVSAPQAGLFVGGVFYPKWNTVGARGKCRVDDLVIKYDIAYEDGDHEDSQSYKEALMSTQIQPADRKFFVEVLHTGCAKSDEGTKYRWVAQPYLEVVARPPKQDKAVQEKCQRLLNEICNRYYMDDIGAYGHNWTILNELPLVYDYGLCRISDKTYKRT